MFIFEVIFGFLRRNLENFVRSPAAYACVICAGVGGIAAQGTFIADVIGWPVRFLAWSINFVVGMFGGPHIPTGLVVYPLIGLTGIAVLFDVAREGVPERWAVYIPMVWPSLFHYIPEDSEWRTGMLKWLNGINNWLWDTLGSKIGGGGQASVLAVIAITCIAMVVFYYERFGAKHNAATESRTSTTTSTPASSRTGGRRRSRPA
jgi:hypothetical protein